MSFKMQRVHVYHAEVEDKPGGVSARLKSLAEAGAHLEYVYSQRSATKPGMGDLYVAPLHGSNELAAAREAGMHEVSEPIVMRVEGDDKAAAKHYRGLNRETKKNHPTLPQFKLPNNVVAALEALSHRDERTPEDVGAKEREYAARASFGGRVHAGGEAVFGIVHEVYCFGVVAHFLDADDGAEAFLAHDVHGVIDIH